ncbi:LysR family transcriptional regulator [Francisellaceae bacterium]|nr:LysR family transcriptional regulator [Francisellaceae bacterium]
MPLPNVQYLEIFIAVIQTGSATLAAKKLNMSTSTCTRALHSLEKNIGRPLFTKNTNKYIPTHYSYELYKNALLMLNEYKKLFNQIKNKKESIKLYVPTEVSKIICNCVLPKVLSTNLDMAYYINSYTSGFINENGLYMQNILPTYDVLFINNNLLHLINLDQWKVITEIKSYEKIYASDKYILQSNPIHHPDDLINHKWLSINNHTNNNYIFFDEQNNQINVNITPMLQLDDETVIIKLIEAGFGVAKIDSLSFSATHDKSLVEVIPEFRLPVNTHSIITRTGCNHKKTEPLIEMLIGCLYGLSSISLK